MRRREGAFNPVAPFSSVHPRVERPRKGEWIGREGVEAIGYSGKRTACVVNNEDGQKGLDASLRNGEGAFGLQECRVGATWED